MQVGKRSGPEALDPWQAYQKLNTTSQINSTGLTQAPLETPSLSPQAVTLVEEQKPKSQTTTMRLPNPNIVNSDFRSSPVASGSNGQICHTI